MVNRHIQPKIANIDFPTLQNPKLHKFENGLNSFVLRETSHNVINLIFTTKSGYYDEDLPGISFFNSKMIRGNTKTKTSSELEQKLDYYGSTLSIQQISDYCQISIFSITKFFNETLLILKDILQNSKFSQSYLNRQKDIKKNEILYEQKQNNIVALKKLKEIVFGKSHPYGKNLEIEELENIKLDDLKSYYKNTFVKNPELFLVGNYTDENLGKIEEVFDKLKLGDKLNTQQSENLKYVANNIFIKREDSLQESIFVGKPFPLKSHEDFLELIILNELLGGYFGSRLMSNIREKNGYTYGIQSKIIPMFNASLFLISSEVNLGKGAPVLNEIFKEIKKLQTEKVSKTELLDLKNYIKGKLLLSLDGTYSTMTSFINAHLFGLNNSYYSKLYEKIQKILPETILNLANKYLEKDTFSKVVVGTQNPF